MALGTWNERQWAGTSCPFQSYLFPKPDCSCPARTSLFWLPHLGYTQMHIVFLQNISKWTLNDNFNIFFPWHRWKNKMSIRKPVTDSQRTTLEPELLDNISQFAFTFEAPHYTEFNLAQEPCTELILHLLLYESSTKSNVFWDQSIQQLLTAIMLLISPENRKIARLILLKSTLYCQILFPIFNSWCIALFMRHFITVLGISLGLAGL